jgi:hypothetical protein
MDALDVAAKGYNICPTAGSALGRKATPETRAKMRVAYTPERRAAQAERAAKYKHAPEALAKMSAAATGRKHSPEARVKVSAAVKKAWTPERRAAQSTRVKKMNAKKRAEKAAKKKAEGEDPPE